MKTNLLHTIIFLFSIFSLTTNAADVVVNGSGLSGTYTTISAGINAANPGDRILVSNQSFPYQEDTIFINKDVTIIPYNDVAHILFEGHIKIILDSISNLTLIGFDSDNTDIHSVFNDTSRNFLSTINIIDCHFNNIFLSQPKTSFYMSYSTAYQVYYAHGDIIANSIINLNLGNFDCSYNNSIVQGNFCLSNFNYSGSSNQIGSNNNFPTECELFSYYVPFGNVSVYSDTCNIIGNDINRFLNVNEDFPFNFMNNQVNSFDVYLIATLNKGVNQIINNNMNSRSYFYAIYCFNTNEFNFSNFELRYLNNNNGTGSNYVEFLTPSNSGNYTLSNLTTNRNSIHSYNRVPNAYANFTFNFIDSTFFVGPWNYNNTNPNPSAEFLNLDLSLNTTGVDGGSYAWNNINPTGTAGFGQLTGSKARITYLNLPTQIFDPSNIRIKAKAVHGN